MRFWKKSLMARLVSSFLLLSLLTVSLVGYMTFIYAREPIKQSVFDRLQAVASFKEEALKRWIEDQRQVVVLFSQSPNLLYYAKRLISLEQSGFYYEFEQNSLLKYLTDTLAGADTREEIFIISNRSGKIVVSTDKTHAGQYWGDTDCFSKGQLNTLVETVCFSTTPHKPMMTIAVPLRDTAGQSFGVLVTLFNLKGMNRIVLERTGLGVTGAAYLTDRSGTLVSGEFSNYGDIGDIPRTLQTEGIKSALKGIDGTGLYPDGKGVPVIGIYRWVEDHQMALILEMSQKDAFAPARRLAWTVFLIGFLSAGLLTAGVYLLAWQIARPVLAITETAKQVAAGDFSYTAPVMTEDEIGTLARVFNGMIDQLRDLIDSLEERVAERTAKLKMTNESLTLIKQAVESATDAVGMSTPEGVHFYQNEAFSKMFEYETAEELAAIGGGPFLYADKSIAEDVFNAITTGGSWTGEVRMKPKDGRKLMVFLRADAIKDESGRIIGLVGIHSDITERKQAEEKLEKANKQLIKAAHQAGMADIATGTLHNVGNILNSVKTSVNIIHEITKESTIEGLKKANSLLRENIDKIEAFITEDPKGQKLMKYYLKLEDILINEQKVIMEHLSRLTNKIDAIVEVILAQQSYAKFGGLTEDYSLIEVIEDALTMQHGTIAQYNITIVKDFQDIPKIPIQKTKLLHILINLVKNAGDAMSEISEKDRVLKISSYCHNTAVYIKVADTGHGIQPKEIQKIFSHGYTTKKTGHGFGLHSSANYMTEMGGKMWAESEGEGKGTMFILQFPSG